MKKKKKMEKKKNWAALSGNLENTHSFTFIPLYDRHINEFNKQNTLK